MALPSITLKKNEERRLKSGHLWIFSNEIDTKQTPLKSLVAGDLVIVNEASGKPLGTAYINPNSLLCARLLSRNAKVSVNRDFFIRRIQWALDLRERLYAEPCYRLIYGESDGLPGLVVDRFGDHLVAQSTTAGMEHLQAHWIEALVAVVQPQSILLRNDSGSRKLEGLTEEKKQVFGETPALIELVENGVGFQIDPWNGQKTGWFYDHRDNRKLLKDWLPGKRVLDIFSYVGSFAVQAAHFGASEVHAVDASESALELLLDNAEKNQVADRVEAFCGDAFKVLKALNDDKEKYDMVIVDPPAFIKRKKDHKSGLQGYRRINELALRLVEDQGILVSASCSMHLKRDELMDCLRLSGRHIDRHLKVFAQGHQGWDHPIHPAIAETEYIKCLFAQVTKSL